MMRELRYRTGDIIREGDLVRVGEWDGTVEFVMTMNSAGWGDFWRERGEGVMLSGPAFGTLYAAFDDEDLMFIQRKEHTN